MRFSFVLPAWKGVFLHDAIASILSQTYGDFELVVVDDCSPDDIKGTVDSFGDKRVTYRRNTHNIGGHDLVAQWNHCLEYAKGDYVVLATDDDLYEPLFLSSMAALTEKYPQVDLLRARVLQVDAGNHIVAIDTCYKELLSHDEFAYHVLHGMKGGIPQYVFKTSVLREKGGFVNFPLAWGADDATAIMMSTNGVATTQEHLVRFRWSGVSISGNAEVMPEKIRARLLFYKWLRHNLTTIEPVDEKSAFLHENIDIFLPVYNKTTLIAYVAHLTLRTRLQCLHEVWRCEEMTKHDRLSVIAHSLK